jgi:NTE family protein
MRSVFSGSGINFYGHAGAAKAAAEMGVAFEGHAGVSGGALVACLLAAGFSPQEMIETLLSFTPVTGLLDPEFKAPWAKEKSTLLSSALPSWWPFKSHGLIKGAKFEHTLRDVLAKRGVKVFRDLKLPFRVFTTNMSKADATGNRFTQWSQETTPGVDVAAPVVASCRIPGVFQARTYRDEQHIDGGVWANFPVDCWNDLNPQGKGTLGFYFGLSSTKATGLGFFPEVISVMLSSRMRDDIEDAPQAVVIDLPEMNGLDFFIDKPTATKLVKDSYLATKKQLGSMKM